MTAALIIRACLSIDIPLFLRHSHEVQTILRESTQLHSQRRPSGAANVIGRNTGLDVAGFLEQTV